MTWSSTAYVIDSDESLDLVFQGGYGWIMDFRIYVEVYTDPAPSETPWEIPPGSSLPLVPTVEGSVYIPPAQ